MTKDDIAKLPTPRTDDVISAMEPHHPSRTKRPTRSPK